MLRVSDVSTFYGNIQALKGISLEVREGEIATLIGSNGAGKTTMLKTIAGLLKPRSGSIEFCGADISRLRASQIVKMGISLCPEGRMVFPRMTVLENLEMGAYARRTRSEVAASFDRVHSIFPVLYERRGQLAGTLSGGEQQMLAIGRALMSKPRLLLLDEPSLGLAPMLVETIFSLIKEINRQGTTILLVEQNARMALMVSHRGYVIETGRIALQGAACDLLSDPSVKKAYLGES